MRNARFAAVGERLLDAGVAPRHARRAVAELTDHFDDLVAELESQGYSHDDAQTEAVARLNPDALVAAAIARPELHSWVRRWPLASCTVFPLGLYITYVIGSIALMVGGVTVFDHVPGDALAISPGLQRFAATYMSGVVFVVPIFAAGTFCSIAQARRAPLGWTLLGAVLVSLIGGMLNAGLTLQPNAPPGLQAGIGLDTDALTQPLLRAALTLAIVLPVYAWRRAISLGRARGPSASQSIAVVAVIGLHAIFTLLMSAARAPTFDSRTNDTAMTLIVISPVTAHPVVAPDRTALPTARSRDTVISLPAAPAGEAPSVGQRAPIDFAREAALAARRGAAAIELERRRARGFTPEAQDREPDVVRTPTPEFDWSPMAQPMEALPDGGMLFRLSERCVIVVTLMVIPACGVGEIPVNGRLFEHMDDPPVLGDWKDDAALPR